MARVNLGILDGFNGKVGKVVGFNKGGRSFMRAYQGNVRNPRTEQQVLVRQRFSELVKMGNAFSDAISIGLRKLATTRKMSVYNAFVKRNWEATAQSTLEEMKVEYTQLTISSGKLPMPSTKSPSFENSLTAEVSLNNNSSEKKASASDDIYLVALQPESGSVVMSDPVKRNEASVKVKVPSTWSGMKAHLYIFAVGGDTTNKGMISNTLYVGSGTIL